VDSFLHRGRGRGDHSAGSSVRPQSRNEGSTTATPVAGAKSHYAAPKRSEKKVRRPAWNDLYNSDLPVPMHLEERTHHLGNANSRANSRQNQRSAAMSHIAAGYANSSSVDLSAIPVDERSLHHNTSSHHTRWDEDYRGGFLPPSRSSSPLPPRPATTSFGDISGPPKHSIGAQKQRPTGGHHRPLTADDVVGGRQNGNPEDGGMSLTAGQRQYQQQLLEPISLEDFSFLQNTFKLRYDINFNRPNWRFGAGTTSSRVAQREKKELGVLKEERRAAAALAAELGIAS
jgi:hypothetical protein